MNATEYPSQLVDIDAYVRRRVTVSNASGGRGYEDGLRVFDCPICRETRQRGWLSITGFSAGCFNAGCDANERLDGGAIEWVRRAEGLRSRSEAWRVIIPITVGERCVSFQARTFRRAEPKYLFARHLPIGTLQAECGRPAAACLFNIDAVHEGDDVLLEIGPGDVMALWSLASRVATSIPVGILGQALTPEKLTMLVQKRPRLVVVGLDQGGAEARRARDPAAALLA